MFEKSFLCLFGRWRWPNRPMQNNAKKAYNWFASENEEIFFRSLCHKVNDTEIVFPIYLTTQSLLDFISLKRRQFEYFLFCREYIDERVARQTFLTVHTHRNCSICVPWLSNSLRMNVGKFSCQCRNDAWTRNHASLYVHNSCMNHCQCDFHRNWIIMFRERNFVFMPMFTAFKLTIYKIVCWIDIRAHKLTQWV